AGYPALQGAHDMKVTTALPRLLEGLRAAAPAHEDADGELLRRFLSRKDEALGDADAAEDAFQATFLLLARRADPAGAQRPLAGDGPLAGGSPAGAWDTARRAGRAEPRRGERLAARPEAGLADDLAWREVRELLDAELARLPDHYRTPLVLCYLEGLPQAEAA